MYIYLINDKIVSSEIEVPKYKENGYVRNIFIPWMDKTKGVFMAHEDIDFIKKLYPKKSTHHVVDITNQLYIYPFIMNESGWTIILSAKLKKDKNMETKTEKYVVMIEGKTSPTKLHDNYESAEHEAKRLCLRERQTAYICKAITKVELNEVTITKL